MKTEIRYYQVPLTNIPFSRIPSLEHIDCKTVICSEYFFPDENGAWLISVFDAFDKTKEVLDNFKELKLFFGTVLSQRFPRGGKNKCILLLKTEIEIEKEDLPHLRYSSKYVDDERGNWFYAKEGKYYLFATTKTEYEKAKHLEDIAIYGDWLIRLRIVIELLKKNIKDGKVKLTTDEIKKIAFEVIRCEPSLSKSTESELMDGVNNWVPTMMFTPLIEDIPEEIRGRVKE